MTIKETYRCARCMQELNEEDTFCTNCGYDQRQNNPERALPAGTLLNDKYLIGAVIGEGGFGITYAAWDTLIETRIAIKEYFPSELVTRDTTLPGEKAVHNLTLIQEKTGKDRYREGLERFVKEAGNLAKFQKQSGVVSVKDFFYENNTAYMVMEYIEGVTLNIYLENHNGKLGTQEAFRMIEPVMKTLEAVHREGVIHRDISPDNIMVTEDGQMKLIDFGAARFVGVDDEKSLTVILKHGYAPEEQYRSNGEQGPWTDVYALSAVIYRMLTGKVPEETLNRMVKKQDSVRTELEKVPGLSWAKKKALEKGLAVKTEKRFLTIRALYEQLYNKEKYGVWRWLACAVGAAAVLSCIFFIASKDKTSENLDEIGDYSQEELAEENNAEEILEEEIETEPEETGKEEIETEKIELATEPEEIMSFSEEELIALVEEYSGKYVGYTSDGKQSACYDDFDGDGRYELFAYVADAWEEVYMGEMAGTGSAIWFSDGDKTLQVEDMEPAGITYEIDTLQFGKNKHFYLYQGAGGPGAWVTTCALDESVPHIVIKERRGVFFYSENGKTYCGMLQNNSYVSNASSRYREDYSMFYVNGEYWEYASKIISEEELLKYSNGAEIIDQIKEEAGKLYIPWEEDSYGWERDFTQYPYIEVENILLNSENGEIFVNMMHWESKEAADYYKSPEGDISRDSKDPSIFRDTAAGLPSETRLSVKNNMLQIEEMKIGHKEVNGTEFTPLYPD